MSSDQEAAVQEVAQPQPPPAPGGVKAQPPEKPKVPMIDRVIKFVDILEPILRIAHVVLKGVKEALHEYKLGTGQPPAQPPDAQQIVQQLGPRQ